MGNEEANKSFSEAMKRLATAEGKIYNKSILKKYFSFTMFQISERKIKI